MNSLTTPAPTIISFVPGSNILPELKRKPGRRSGARGVTPRRETLASPPPARRLAPTTTYNSGEVIERPDASRAKPGDSSSKRTASDDMVELSSASEPVPRIIAMSSEPVPATVFAKPSDMARKASSVATTSAIERMVVIDPQKRLGRPLMVMAMTAEIWRTMEAKR